MNYIDITQNKNTHCVQNNTVVITHREGIQGPPGKNGYTPTIGENGNWYINEYDTGISAKGKDGFSPYINPETGNWVDANGDTGIPATGTDGGSIPAKEILFYNSINLFPETGVTNLLYVDKEKNSIYGWNDELKKYVLYNDNTLDIQQIENKLSNKVDTEVFSETISSLATKEDIENIDLKKINSSDLLENNIIKSSLLPDYTDVIEGVLISNNNFISNTDSNINVSGKLYIDINTKLLYYYDGNQYVNIPTSTKNDNSELEDVKKELEEQNIKINSIESKVEQNIDKIDQLIISDESKSNRLTAIEERLVDQIEKVSSLETSFEFQVDKLNHLDEKVDHILSFESPDGTFTLGALAFKDTVDNDDITNISFSKITQNEDEELELYCGDSTN